MMAAMSHQEFTAKVGQRVRVTQQIPRLSGGHATTVEGEVVEIGPAKSGSWYAHAPDGKVWLDRVTLRKADGEIVRLNLDRYSRIEWVSKS